MVAAEMAKARREMVEFFLREYKRSPEEAIAESSQCHAGYLDSVSSQPSDQISFHCLDMLTEAGREDEALGIWNRIKDEARTDIESGHRAARIIEPHGSSSPRTKARFLMLRASFRREWKPLPGIESALVDHLAQIQVAYEHWLHEHMVRSTYAPVMGYRQEDIKRAKRDGTWLLPSVSHAEAIEQAAAMADRWQRAFLRTVRALRDLRRYSPTVIVQNAGQVNVGQTQINACRAETEFSSKED